MLSLCAGRQPSLVSPLGLALSRRARCARPPWRRCAVRWRHAWKQLKVASRCCSTRTPVDAAGREPVRGASPLAGAVRACRCPCGHGRLGRAWSCPSGPGVSTGLALAAPSRWVAGRTPGQSETRTSDAGVRSPVTQQLQWSPRQRRCAGNTRSTRTLHGLSYKDTCAPPPSTPFTPMWRTPPTRCVHPIPRSVSSQGVKGSPPACGAFSGCLRTPPHALHTPNWPIGVDWASVCCASNFSVLGA